MTTPPPSPPEFQALIAAAVDERPGPTIRAAAAAVGRELGYSEETILSWMYARRVPHPSTRKAISEAINKKSGRRQ